MSCIYILTTRATEPGQYLEQTHEMKRKITFIPQVAGGSISYLTSLYIRAYLLIFNITSVLYFDVATAHRIINQTHYKFPKQPREHVDFDETVSQYGIIWIRWMTLM